MEKALGTIVLLVGLAMVAGGFIYAATTGPGVPNSVLGLFSPITAIGVFGGAVVFFCGFALIAVGPHYRNAGKSSK